MRQIKFSLGINMVKFIIDRPKELIISALYDEEHPRWFQIYPAYLLSAPANTKRVLGSIVQVITGGCVCHTCNQPFWMLERFQILNSILLCFLKSAKKPGLFQTTYILPWAVFPCRPIFPKVHLLPTLSTVRLVLSLKCVELWQLTDQNERYGCQ